MDDHLIPLQTPCVYYDPSFLPPSEADSAFEDLKQNTPWEKSPKINRWVTLMELPQTNNEGDINYKYRDAPGKAIQGFPPSVMKLKLLAEEWYNSKRQLELSQSNRHNETFQPVSFNICLLNYYPTSQHRLGWHSDREELGRTTPIASISLGCPRTFLIRSKTDGMRDRASIRMENGSLVLMENICQMKYLHSVPKEDGDCDDTGGGRINLTFRCKDYNVGTTAGELEHEKRDMWLDAIQKDGGNEDVMASGWRPGDASFNLKDDIVFGDTVQYYDPELHYSVKVKYVIRTNIGAERYCAAELGEMLDMELYEMLARPFGIAGYVAVCRRCDDSSDDESSQENASQVQSSLLQLRTAHHILRYHDHFDLDDVIVFNTRQQNHAEVSDKASIDGEMLYQYYKNRLVSSEGYVKTLTDLESGTFRVSCERIGNHAFHAPEVEREMGGALSEFYSHIKPKMNDFDVNVRIDVVANKIIIGTQLNVDDISKDRHFLRFRNAVTIKTNLAYAMIRLANIQADNLICDPFCGSGTILLEALDCYRDQRIKCIGMDVSRRSANGARDNAYAEGFGEDVCQFHCCDARNFRKHLEENSVDAIVSNLPWGVMTGHKNVSDLQSMYEVFLRTAWYILKPKSRIVMLVLRGLQLTRIIRKLSGRYKLLSVNVVRTTNNLPSIVVIEKLAMDEVRDSVKRQLGYLAQFVNVSSEMYQAVHYEKIDETTL